MTEANETAVLARAKQNFIDNGQGDRMWDKPSAGNASAISDVFYLTDQERGEYMAQARRDLIKGSYT